MALEERPLGTSSFTLQVLWPSPILVVGERADYRGGWGSDEGFESWCYLKYTWVLEALTLTTAQNPELEMGSWTWSYITKSFHIQGLESEMFFSKVMPFLISST